MIFFWILVLMFLGIPVLAIAWELFKAIFWAGLVCALGIGIFVGCIAMFSH